MQLKTVCLLIALGLGSLAQTAEKPKPRQYVLPPSYQTQLRELDKEEQLLQAQLQTIRVVRMNTLLNARRELEIKVREDELWTLELLNSQGQSIYVLKRKEEAVPAAPKPTPPQPEK